MGSHDRSGPVTGFLVHGVMRQADGKCGFRLKLVEHEQEIRGIVRRWMHDGWTSISWARFERCDEVVLDKASSTR